MKKIILSAIIVASLILIGGCGKHEIATTEIPENPPVIETPDEPEEEFNERQYPMDQHGAVDITYAKELLVEKSAGKELAPSDEELIDYFFIEDGKGIAWVDFHTIGMQKSVSRVFRTLNGGKTWALLEEELTFLGGPYDCTHINGKMVISNFASVVETHLFFIIDVEGNTKIIESEEVSDIVDLQGMYAEFQPSENKNEIVCHWKKYDYEDPRVVYVSVHDKDMKTLDIRKYKE